MTYSSVPYALSGPAYGSGDWDYCPIIIQFEPAVLDAQGDPLPGDRYRLKIKAPVSNRRGVRQSMKSEYFIEVPENGLVQLRLMPSDRYIPNGEYEVLYYVENQVNPIDTQKWIVPAKPGARHYSFVWDGNPPALPVDLFSVTQMSPYYEFTYSYNEILWTAEPPPQNTEIEILYQPAASLQELLIPAKPYVY